MKCLTFLSLVLVLFSVAKCQQEKPETEGVDGESQVIQPNSPQEIQRERTTCSRKTRRYNGVCTNRVFKLWGSTGRAQGSLFPLHSSRKPSGRQLPSARAISNALCQQSKDVFNDRGLNELTTFFGQFLDHTFVATPASTRQMPIKIPDDDSIFGNFTNHELKFTRSKRARVDLEGILGNPAVNKNAFLFPIERPVNSLTALLDLASVYGVTTQRGNALRTLSGGMLKTSTGDMLPLNIGGFSNAPFPAPDYFLAGDHRANENPALTALHVIFVREHNDICRELAEKFPKWSDGRLFRVARKINEVQFQYIVLEEYYPAMVGKRLPRYKGYNPKRNPIIIDAFSTAAFRVGHTMVGNGLKLYAKGGVQLPDVPFEKMFFLKAADYTEGVEPYLRGILKTKAQEIDMKIQDSIRNFLFTGIPVEDVAFDLIALNIQRGRDHALPTFNMIRRFLKLRPAWSFAGISKDLNVQSALQSVYKTVDKVEAWVGMMAEDHEKGSSMGVTMNTIWAMQFAVLRDGDRFFYENGLFGNGFVRRIPRLQKVFRGKGSVLKDILVRNSLLEESEVPNKVFF